MNHQTDEGLLNFNSANEGPWFEVVKNNRDGILLIDQEGIVRYINQAWLKMMGMEERELLGKPLTFSLPEGEKGEIEWTHKGRVIALEINRYPVRWNGMVGQVVILHETGLEKRYENLQLAYKELSDAFDATLKSWANAIEVRCRKKFDHTQKSLELTLKLARKLGVSEEEMANISRGVWLHDIGEMMIPDNILCKVGALTQDEWEIMLSHPGWAYELLSSIPYLQPALDIPYCHHEKWDGSGYPRGLKGEEIPLSARIFAVADVWNALLSDRTYRRAWSIKTARAFMQEQAGKQFDPAIIKEFMEMSFE
jgi:response regulator RpfG family c-di-GMP phosphodiesterase